MGLKVGVGLHVDGKLGSCRALLWLPNAEETSSPGTDSKFKVNLSAGSFIVGCD